MKNATRKKSIRRFFLVVIGILCAVSIFAMQANNLPDRSDSPLVNPLTNQSTESQSTERSQPDLITTPAPTLLSDPFLQLPGESSVQVVWFTEFPGTQHTVEYGEGLTIEAVTTQLSRTREDSDSRVQGRAYPELTRREIWRHEATVTGLVPGKRVPYRVISRHTDGESVTSKQFTLATTPPQGQPLSILLTSDHQLMPMTPANLQKVAETVGQVDAVFLAGDLVNIPDRASEWFDDARGLAFFPSLQGRAHYRLEKEGDRTLYTGGELIQHAPLFPALGNHEVMGRYATTEKLKAEFTNTLPRHLVSQFYPTPAGSEDAEAWIKDHSYNSDTYEEIFSLPTTKLPNGQETQKYYAVSFGDIRLVSLYVTQIWRSPALSPSAKGRYRESNATLNAPETWGYGQHIFEDIHKGSPQYQWLQQELASDEFQNAKYKIVMLHHPPHTLGGNIVPAFTDPVTIENRDAEGNLQSVQYEYPKADDYITRDLEPLLESADVDLVFYGHSHLWNRFISDGGLHFLETSNVGNSYGAHLADNPRNVPTTEQATENGLQPFRESYIATGNPNELEPITPNLAPLQDTNGEALPYIASNDITSFTIFNTGDATISSYYFDTRQPGSEVVKFDEFRMTQ